MIEKRFTETVSTGIVADNKTGIEYSCEMRVDDDFLNLVNTLADENEQLEQKIKSITKILKEDIGYAESFRKIEEVLK